MSARLDGKIAVITGAWSVYGQRRDAMEAALDRMEAS